MKAKEDGTGTPTLIQSARVKLAGILMGPIMWRWLIRQDVTRDLIQSVKKGTVFVQAVKQQ